MFIPLIVLLLGIALHVLAERPAPPESVPYVSTFEIVSTMPHDPDAFTQGLTFGPDGTLYESDGVLLTIMPRRDADGIHLGPAAASVLA